MRNLLLGMALMWILRRLAVWFWQRWRAFDDLPADLRRRSC